MNKQAGQGERPYRFSSLERVLILIFILFWLVVGSLGAVAAAFNHDESEKNDPVVEEAEEAEEAVTPAFDSENDRKEEAPVQAAEALPTPEPIKELPSEKDIIAISPLPEPDEVTPGTKSEEKRVEAPPSQESEASRTESAVSEPPRDIKRQDQSKEKDLRAACEEAHQGCWDLCPEGGVLDDALDLGVDDTGVCEAACADGRKRCIKNIEADPCGHFHGACRYRCEEEAYDLDLCEDSCDEGFDMCKASLAKEQ